MTLLAVQAHVQTLLSGLTTPQLQGIGVGAANAFVAPPAITTDAMTDPEIYVWGGRTKDKRHSGPRNQLGAANWSQPTPTLPTLPVTSAGFRRADWLLDIWLMMLAPSPSGQPADDYPFPLLIGAVMKQLALDLMPQQLTDPQTGDVSQLVHIGEDMDLEYTTPQETADERTQLYTALITCQVREDYGL